MSLLRFDVVNDAPSLAPLVDGMRQPVLDIAGRAVDAEHASRLPQCSERIAHVDRWRAMLLRQLFAVGAEHQRQVQIARRRQAEQALQMHLPRRVVGEILAANDIGDALCRVVDHDRELICREPVGALEYEVADLVGQVLHECAEPTVVPVA